MLFKFASETDPDCQSVIAAMEALAMTEERDAQDRRDLGRDGPGSADWGSGQDCCGYLNYWDQTQIPGVCNTSCPVHPSH